MPCYKTPLELQMYSESQETRSLVEKLYKRMGEPHKPEKKKVRVGYKGYKEEEVYLTSKQMLEFILRGN